MKDIRFERFGKKFGACLLSVLMICGFSGCAGDAQQTPNAGIVDSGNQGDTGTGNTQEPTNSQNGTGSSTDDDFFS